MPPRDLALLIFVCLAGAANNLVTKFVVSTLGVPPLAFATLRFAIVALATLPWLLPAPRPIPRVVVVALLMGAGTFGLLFLGMRSSPASAVAVVGQLNVPITTVLGIFMLGERVGPQRWIGILLSFFGTVMVMWDPHRLGISPGLLFVVGSALTLSLGAVLLKRLEGVKPLQLQAWVGFCSVWVLCLGSALSETGQVQAVVAAGWPLVVAALFSAIVISVVSHTVLYFLIDRYEANLVAPLMVMAPLATVLLGVTLFHEPFGARMVWGASIALGGVMVVVLRPQLLLVRLAAWSGRAAAPRPAGRLPAAADSAEPDKKRLSRP